MNVKWWTIPIALVVGAGIAVGIVLFATGGAGRDLNKQLSDALSANKSLRTALDDAVSANHGLADAVQKLHGQLDAASELEAPTNLGSRYATQASTHQSERPLYLRVR